MDDSKILIILRDRGLLISLHNAVVDRVPHLDALGDLRALNFEFTRNVMELTQEAALLFDERFVLLGCKSRPIDAFAFCELCAGHHSDIVRGRSDTGLNGRTG